MKAAKNEAVSYLKVEGRDHGTIASRLAKSDDIVTHAFKDFITNHNRGDETE